MGRTAKNTTAKAEETKEPKVATKTEKKDESAELIKQLMAQIEEQNKKMAEMQEQLAETSKSNKEDTVKEDTIKKTVDESVLRGRKFKLINLVHGILNVSTEPDGRGRVFTFNKYGETRLVRFDDVCDIVASYPYTTEHGLIYIADKDMVDYLGLTQDYANIYTKDCIDEIVLLKDDKDVELFLGMEKYLQESTAKAIAERINANENVDYNRVNRIKTESGLDILKLAEEIKR